MRTQHGYRSWGTACIQMAPSLQYTPEQKHEDGYGPWHGTAERIDEMERAFSLSLLARKAVRV